ncbi:MAG: prohibitin family protein [Clostridiales bacterium]|nr:prohibitin family protein [Clostridiales bacterium]
MALLFLAIIIIVGGLVWRTIISRNIKANEKEYPNRDNSQLRLRMTLILIAIPVLIAMLTVGFGFRIIGATEGAVVKTFGKPGNTLYAGLHIINPVTQTLQKYDLALQQIDLNYDAYTKEGQTVLVKSIVQYTIQRDNLRKITSEFGTQSTLNDRIVRIAEAQSKVLFSEQSAMGLIEIRALLEEKTYALITNALGENYYVDIRKAEIVDIAFSEEFLRSISAKVQAEQEKLRAQTEAEKARIEADRDRDVAITQADAVLQSAKKHAEAAIEEARGEAEAQRIRQEVWQSMSAEVRAAILAEMYYGTWNGQLPATMLGSDTSVILGPEQR